MYEIKGQVISLIAAEEIKAEQKYMPVYISGDNACKVTGGNGETKYVGYVQAEGKLGEAVPVMIDGVTMFKATGSVSAGAVVTGGGIALAAASHAGDIIPVLIK